LIASPSLRSLRRVGRLSTTTLVALAEARGPALAIERLGPVGLPQNPPAELDRLRAAEAERLVEVRELRLHPRDRMASKRPDDFDWLFATALGRRLTSIRLSAMTLVNEETSHVPWSQWAAARTRWPKIERLRVDAGVISVEMCDRQLIVRTLQSDDPIPYYDDDACQQLAQLRDHFDRLELISCDAKPLSNSTAARWAQAAGFREFVHTHA